MILFIGCQGAGKTTFYKAQFFASHVRVNLDMLKTRHRERLLVMACLNMKQRFVVDNTNATARERARYMELARGSGFAIAGYYFDTPLSEALERNARREGKERIPEIAVRGTHRKIEPPHYAEGFDDLYRVRVLADGSYGVARMEAEGTSHEI